MLIYSKNNLDVNAPVSYLTNQEVSGTNVLRWKNSNGASASWAVQVGKTGNKQSETVVLGTYIPAGTAGTLSGTTLYEHPTDTPLYFIKYDQVVFERSTAGTTGTAIPLTNGTVTYQADSPTTIFDDTSGTPSYGYRSYFRNSITGETTSESDWLTSAGFSFYSLAKLRQRVKDKLYDATYIPNDLMIDDWLNEWYQQMNNTLNEVNEDYAIGTTSVAFASNTEFGTITDTNFKGMTKRVWWMDNGGTYVASKMDSNSFSPARIFNSTVPYYYFQGDTVIGHKPSDTAGTLLIEYQKDQAILVNDTDEVPVPMHAHTKSFVDYALAQAKRKDNKFSEGSELENVAYQQLGIFKTQISSRLRTSPTFVNIVEATGEDSSPWF